MHCNFGEMVVLDLPLIGEAPLVILVQVVGILQER